MPNTNMQKPQEYTAIFENKEVYNEKFEHYHFELKSPYILNFQAGHYVSLVVNEAGLHRAYSICSDPDIDHGIEILLDVMPQGAGVSYFQNLKYGDEIKFLAPMGRFVIKENPDREAIVLVGTGSGIAPLHSMVVDQLKNNSFSKPIILYWGLRHASHLIWQDEFTRWSKSFPNFKFHPTLSRPETQWPLCRGRVTDCLQMHDLPPKADYYLCGCKEMVNEAKQILQQREVPIANIFHEKFF